MSSRIARRRLRSVAAVGGLLLVLLLPATALGHADLATSSPADGATVNGPVTDPIVLTFTESLIGDSGADLRDSAGLVSATDSSDGDTITIVPDAALGEGDYAVEWTAITDDGYIERGTVRFTVVVPATPAPTATPSATPGASATTPSPVASPVTSPSPSAVPTAVASPAGSGEVILPIMLGALLVGGLALLLLRRRDATTP